MVEGTYSSRGFLGAFWKFLRPHTIRGTILGSSAVTVRALIEAPEAIDIGLVPRALIGVLALICGNGFIVGINQIYDVEIDQVNKPFLPIAAGELSATKAWALCLALAAAGTSIAAGFFGPFIGALYVFGLFLGTVYSVPPLRLKRFAVPAFLIIATVRGFLLNFGVYSAVRAALALPFRWSPHIAFITCFVTLFATVIAITKDLPDVEGDRLENIKTLATTYGVKAVSLLAVGLLLCNYAGAVYLGVARPDVFRAPVMVLGHLGLAAYLLLKTRELHRKEYNRSGIIGFYRNIWVCFYSEYFLWTFC